MNILAIVMRQRATSLRESLTKRSVSACIEFDSCLVQVSRFVGREHIVAGTMAAHVLYQMSALPNFPSELQAILEMIVPAIHVVKQFNQYWFTEASMDQLDSAVGESIRAFVKNTVNAHRKMKVHVSAHTGGSVRGAGGAQNYDSVVSVLFEFVKFIQAMEEGHRGARAVILAGNWYEPGLDVLLHHCAIDALKSLAIDGFSDLQRRVLMLAPSLASLLGMPLAGRKEDAVIRNVPTRLQLGYRVRRGLRFSVIDDALHCSALESSFESLRLPVGIVANVKQALLHSVSAPMRPVTRTGRIDVWQKLWCHGSASVPTRCHLGSWVSFQGSIGGEGFRFDESFGDIRTFGKLRGIVSISGCSPVVVIQLAHFDRQNSRQLHGGFAALRFTLLNHLHCVIVSNSDEIRAEVLVHDCQRATVDGTPCESESLTMPELPHSFKTKRRSAMKSAAVIRHSDEPVFMRFDAILSANRK
jgi:hypothetical protein